MHYQLSNAREMLSSVNDLVEAVTNCQVFVNSVLINGMYFHRLIWFLTRFFYLFQVHDLVIINFTYAGLFPEEFLKFIIL